MGGGSSVPSRVPPEALLAGVTCDPRIGEVSKEEAIEAIALSLCGSTTAPKEEFFNWIMGPRFQAFDSPERMDFCNYNAKFFYGLCAKKGTVIGLRDPDTKEVLGVLCLLRKPPTDGEMMSVIMSLGKPPHYKPKVWGKEPPKREAALTKGMKKLAYKGPQYVVYLMAVKPAHQGKKVGGALLKAVLALSDRDSVPAYLECAGERLQGLYGHLGFERHALAEIEDPSNQEGSGPLKMASMLRKPG
jgi:GNAT superfamily N-acetyltransferase